MKIYLGEQGLKLFNEALENEFKKRNKFKMNIQTEKFLERQEELEKIFKRLDERFLKVNESLDELKKTFKDGFKNLEENLEQIENKIK